MSKSYENEITSLSHEKSRLKEELLKADMNVERLAAENKELHDRLMSETSGLQQ